MRRARAGRGRAALGALVLLALGLGAGGSIAGAAPRQATPPSTTPSTADATDGSATYDQLARCVSDTGQLLVVLLVDESGSLQQTDPKAVRVAAAKTALSGLTQLTDAAGGGAKVDVMVSTFSNTFKVFGDWAPLNRTTLPLLQGRVDGLASRNTGMDTDFNTALSGARDALAEKAVASTQEDKSVCKAVLLFTDGKYDLGVRTTDAQKAKYGSTKPYAPNIQLTTDAAVTRVEQLGVASLCRRGGVADQLRADEIATLTVALTAKVSPADQNFLKAVTLGKADKTTCGKRNGARTGVFLAADDLESLIGTFDAVATRLAGGSPAGGPVALTACDATPCKEGRAEFAVDASLRRVHLFVTVPTPTTQIYVAAPGSGAPLKLVDRNAGSSPLGGGTVSHTWPSAKAATIDIVPGAASAGTWSVTLVDPSGQGGKGSVQIYSFTDVVPVLTTGSSIQVGTPSPLRATVVTRNGGKAVTNLRTATIVAQITDPITGNTTEVPFITADGKYGAMYQPPAKLTTSVLRVVLRLDAVTRDGVRLTSTSAEQSVPTRKPDGYPLVGPSELDLSPITGKGSAESQLLLFSTGKGNIAGCLWVAEPTITAAPEDATPVDFTVEGAGRTAKACLPSPPTGNKPVIIRFDPHGRASGSVRGSIRVWTTAGKQPALATDIPFSFEMTRGVDKTKQIFVFLLLLVGGVALPVILLLVMNVLSTRFQAVKYVQAANLPIVVRKNGQVMRPAVVAEQPDQEEELYLYGYDFKPLESSESTKRFSWAGLSFTARTPLNPFAPGYATAAPEGGTADVAREGRKVNLALSLAGSWIFLYDPAATDAASRRLTGDIPDGDHPEIHGRLVAFVARGPVPAQAERLVNDIFDRLPRTARRLSDLADANRRASTKALKEKVAKDRAVAAGKAKAERDKAKAKGAKQDGKGAKRDGKGKGDPPAG